MKRAAVKHCVQTWKSVIGLEVHAQISSKTKLFSRAGTLFGKPVNDQVSLFDCATPGTLPVLNRKCVEAAVITSLALNCSVNLTSEFDRKHYFYADLPTGYQITQQRRPIAQDGYLDIVTSRSLKKRVRIKQLQLEQDSGKSLHDLAEGRSLIDLNRAGVALMEIVFDPDLSDAEDAAALVNELILILRKLQTCDCKMDEGSLRVDANISVHRPGEPLGTRTEVKNLNSTRAVAKAISYEIERQIGVLESGGEVVNETRGFDSVFNQTVPMRDKEVKQDYRYMPEPNLPPIRLEDNPSASSKRINLAEIRKRIPVLPHQVRTQLIEEYGLTLDNATVLLNNEEIMDFFYKSAKNCNVLPKKLFHFIITDLFSVLVEKDVSLSDCGVTPEVLADIAQLLHENRVSIATSDKLLQIYVEGEEKPPKQLVQENGWMILSDNAQLERICSDVIEKLPKAAKDYRRGKKKAINALAGQVKAATNGLADMKLVLEILKKLLDG